MFTIPKSKRADISRIPPEILGEIFIHCLPPDFRSRDAPRLLLSSVCRLWHALVLATPALWASLCITCHAGVLRPPLPVIRTHLQRSRTRLLSFFLDTYRDPDGPHLLSVLATLAASRKRWHGVKLRLYRMAHDILDLLTQGDTPLLQSIKCDVCRSAPEFPIPLRMLDRCPRLELFRWSNPGPPLLPLVNTSLTSLSLGTGLGVSTCITLLRLSPRLSSACFSVFDPLDTTAIPHLTHLTLCTLVVYGNHANVLLAALTLPALLDLDITAVRNTPAGPLAWDMLLPAFLERSKPKLRKLFVYINGAEVEPTFLRTLALTPHIRNLQLQTDSSPLTATLIRALYPQSQPSAPLCPHLQILDISEISDCPDGLCTEMLRARWGAQAHANGVACLESAHIDIDKGAHYRDLAEMKKLRAEGMQGEILWVEN